MPTQPWDIPEHDFPRTAPRREQLAFLVEYAVLAPSTYNTQPWRFVLEEDAVQLYADSDRMLPGLDPDGRELWMSCGAALFHLRIAAHHYGYAPVIRTWPDGGEDNHIATIRLGPACEPTLRQEHLFSAIQKRRTVRDDFDDRPVSGSEVERLIRAADREGADLVAASRSDRPYLAEWSVEAGRVLATDPAVRKEWAAWGAVDPDRDDGVPRTSRHLGVLRTHTAPFLVRLPGGFTRVAAESSERIEAAPCIVVLATRQDDRPAWLDAGQALDRVLLQATAFGLAASFINHPLKVDWIRDQVAERLCPGRFPQAILRIGVPADRSDATPRRPAGSVTETVDTADDPLYP
jgi:nitroreductase